MPHSLQTAVNRDANTQTPSRLATPAMWDEAVREYSRYSIGAAPNNDDTITPDALVFGEYEILDVLGRGGMGFVFKARHRRMDRLVALKMLPAPDDASEEVLIRFRREVQVSAKLDHPHVVSAFDARFGPGPIYLITELIDGEDLSSLVERDGPVSIKDAIDLTIQAAKGLAYLHENGVVHRDVKPNNLVVDTEGVVKVLDLGIARIDGVWRNDVTGGGLTMEGQLVGTISFMSPEQAEDSRTAGPTADVYGLGCTLCYLLTGEPPYARDTFVKTVLAHRGDPIPELWKRRPDIPATVQRVFAKAIAKTPAGRYQTMTEFIAAMEHAVANVSDDDFGADLGALPAPAPLVRLNEQLPISPDVTRPNETGPHALGLRRQPSPSRKQDWSRLAPIAASGVLLLIATIFAIYATVGGAAGSKRTATNAEGNREIASGNDSTEQGGSKPTSPTDTDATKIDSNPTGDFALQTTENTQSIESTQPFGVSPPPPELTTTGDDAATPKPSAPPEPRAEVLSSSIVDSAAVGDSPTTPPAVTALPVETDATFPMQFEVTFVSNGRSETAGTLDGAADRITRLADGHRSALEARKTPLTFEARFEVDSKSFIVKNVIVAEQIVQRLSVGEAASVVFTDAKAAPVQAQAEYDAARDYIRTRFRRDMQDAAGQRPPDARTLRRVIAKAIHDGQEGGMIPETFDIKLTPQAVIELVGDLVPRSPAPQPARQGSNNTGGAIGQLNPRPLLPPPPPPRNNGGRPGGGRGR